ncbi:MAG: alpha/beta fold hydrolase [Candidatus Dormibacteria bacterium]
MQTPDGRTLDVMDVGEPTGAVVYYHHGTPGSCLLAPAWVEDAISRGLRLIGHSRPGYGGSDRLEGRTVGQVASDVAAVLDHLGVARFATWGVSGGGPHALACAALLPDRVVAAASISGVAPYGVDGLNWVEGMGELNVQEFQVAISGDRAAVLASADAMAGAFRGAGPGQLAQEMATILSPVDAAAMDTSFGQFLVASTAEGLRRGGAGSADDDLAFLAPWGFDVSSITAPVQVWQGEQDLMVPAAHGAWLAAHIPGAEAHLEPPLGHLTITATRIGEVHSWLAGHL